MNRKAEVNRMIRMRRLRVNEAMRSLVRETSVSKSDLVYPMFVIEGNDIRWILCRESISILSTGWMKSWIE